MLNAVKSVLAELCSDEGLTLETSANTLFTAFSISTSTLRSYIARSTTSSLTSFLRNVLISGLVVSIFCVVFTAGHELESPPRRLPNPELSRRTHLIILMSCYNSVSVLIPFYTTARFKRYQSILSRILTAIMSKRFACFGINNSSCNVHKQVKRPLKTYHFG